MVRTNFLKKLIDKFSSPCFGSLISLIFALSQLSIFLHLNSFVDQRLSSKENFEIPFEPLTFHSVFLNFNVILVFLLASN